MAHADATDDPLAKEVLTDIANEERVHAGEFERLLDILTGDEPKWRAEGHAEVDELAAALRGGGESAVAEAADQAPTIGSMKD
jgi:rubrerythrin